MEIGFRRLFLGLPGLIALGFGPVTSAYAQSADAQPEQQNQLIQPEVERQEFDEAEIDADDFEIILAVGYLSIEDFGVEELLSLKLNYHINEDIYVQAAFGLVEAGQTSYEVLSAGAPLLTDDERELSFYRINVGFNLLPGEAFLGDSVAHNTAFYLSAGIGNTEFAGDDRFTINYGAGYRFLLNDVTGFYVDFRNSFFDIDVFGENKVANNLEFTLGASLFF